VRWSLLFLCVSVLEGQGGTDPKPKPEDYEAHTKVGAVSIGAEFLIHSFSGQNVTYLAPDFLVVEVALYPPKGAEIDVQPTGFSLRLNGRKPLSPAQVSLVQSSLDHPEWRPTPRLEAGAGVGDGAVVLGAPRQEKIPGRPPQTYPVPGPDENPAAPGVSRDPHPTASQLLVQTALPVGIHRGPVSGYLYFPFRGKPGSLKTVELLFQDAVVHLR